MRVIIKGAGPTIGMDYCDALGIYDTLQQAEEDGFQYAVQHLESYGYDYDPEGEDDYETVTSEVDFELVEYDPEKHDMLKAGGGSFEGEFARMERDF